MTTYFAALFFKVFFVVAIILVIIFIINKRNGNAYRGNRNYKSLTRSQNDRYIAGVCGGIAEYFGWNSSLVRVVFVLLGGFGMVLPYIVLALILPVSK